MEFRSILSNILKIILFLIVSGAAIYVAYMSKNKGLQEHFEEDINEIDAAFMNVLSRKPKKNEIDFFSSMDSSYTRQEYEIWLNKLKDKFKKTFITIVKRDPSSDEVIENISSFTTYNYTDDDLAKYIELRFNSSTSPSLPPELDVESTIVSTFQSTLNRDPSPEEIIKYKNLHQTNELPIAKLLDKIKESDEYLQILNNKSQKELVENIEKIDQEEIKSDIKSIFKAILQRSPTDIELNDYYEDIRSERLKLKELIDKLESSEEYKKLNTIQNIESTIKTEFQKVYTRDPNENEYKFIKEKVENSNFDNQKLNQYIQRLKLLDSSNSDDRTYIDMIEGRKEDDLFYMLNKDSSNSMYSYMAINEKNKINSHMCEPCTPCPLTDQTSLIGKQIDADNYETFGSILS